MSRHSASWWQQVLHNKVVAVVIAMAVAVPLIAAPMAQSNASIAALAFEGFGILLLAMLLWNADWKLDKERVGAFLKTGANLPALLFLGLAVVSCLLSPHKNYSIQETLRIGAGVLLYFVVAYKFRRSEHLSKLVDTLLFVAIAASLVGFSQYAASPAQYATGLFGDHQLFGSFLMILLPIIAVVAITEAKPGRQLAAQIATVLTIACLLITHTRSAWIGAAAGLATLAVLAMIVGARRSRLTGAKHQVVLPVMLMAVAAGFFLLIWPQTSSIVGRATSLSNTSQEAGWTYRQSMWQGTLKMIKERPLSGFGVGLFPYYQWQYTHSGIPVSLGTMRPTLGEQAHNLYIQSAAELGLPGVLLLVAGPVTFLVMGVRRVRTMDAGLRRNLLIGAMAATVAYLVDAIGSPAWQCGQVSMFSWLILGVGVNSLRLPSKSQEETSELSTSFRVTRRATALASLVLTPLLATAALADVADYGVVVDGFVGDSAGMTVKQQTYTVANGSHVNLHTYLKFGTPGATSELGTGFVDVTNWPFQQRVGGLPVTITYSSSAPAKNAVMDGDPGATGITTTPGFVAVLAAKNTTSVQIGFAYTQGTNVFPGGQAALAKSTWSITP